ncbi:MAG: hypothetical protein WCO86_19035, partial [Planctomycetota bacterium]
MGNTNDQPKQHVADPQNRHLRPEIQQIISQGTAVPTLCQGSTRSAALLVASSMLLLWLSFTPVEWSFLAWIALVPLSQLLRLKTLPRRCFFVTWCVSFVWALATLQWMRLGHLAMLPALAALAFYVALYIPAFVWIGRRCVVQGMPVWLAVPIVWTSLEYIRSWLITGFAWYFLAHSQYRWSVLIQICDITGVYGLTFLVALVSGAIAVHVPAAWLQRLKLSLEAAAPVTRTRLQRLPLFTAITVFVTCLGYGLHRRTPTAEFLGGPVFALIQGNFSPEMKEDQAEYTTRYRVHDSLTQEAVL